jgi:hypothetical protein
VKILKLEFTADKAHAKHKSIALRNNCGVGDLNVREVAQS